MGNGERGFTLIETLVSLAIATVVGVLFYQAINAGTRAAQVVDRQEQALLVARSQLSVLGVESPLTPGQRRGVGAQGLSWVITVKPYRQRDGAGEAGHPKAYWASIKVSWRDNRTRKRRSLRLMTLKLGQTK